MTTILLTTTEKVRFKVCHLRGRCITQVSLTVSLLTLLAKMRYARRQAIQQPSTRTVIKPWIPSPQGTALTPLINTASHEFKYTAKPPLGSASLRQFAQWQSPTNQKTSWCQHREGGERLIGLYGQLENYCRFLVAIFVCLYQKIWILIISENLDIDNQYYISMPRLQYCCQPCLIHYFKNKCA